MPACPPNTGSGPARRGCDTSGWPLARGRPSQSDAATVGTDATAAPVTDLARGRTWYHGSEAVFTEFDPARIGSAMGVRAPGFWFFDRPEGTGFYGAHRAEVEVFPDSVMTVSREAFEKEGRGPSWWAWQAARDEHDAVLIEGIQDGDTVGTVLCVFDPALVRIVDWTPWWDEAADPEGLNAATEQALLAFAEFRAPRIQATARPHRRAP